MQILQIDLSGINKLLASIEAHLLPIMLSATAIGTLSMALIQTLKDMFPLREIFHKANIKQWITDQRKPVDNHIGYFQKYNEKIQSPDQKKILPEMLFSATDQDLVKKDLLKLTVNGNEGALYALPIEQLCGQINSASQICLDYPSLHSSLLLTLAANTSSADLFKVMFPDRSLNERSSAEDKKEYTDARNRVAHQIQRAIDSIQISIGYKWELWLKIGSIVVSSVIAGIGLLATNQNIFLVIPLAILGGFLAPVARDLVVALQSLRK